MVWTNGDHIQLLYNSNNIATALSFGGSIFMIYHCLRTPKPRSTTVTMILSIAIADFLYSISNLMSAFQDAGPKVSPFCYAEAALRAFSYVLSVFFASCLGILCYKTVVNGLDFNQDAFFKKALIVGVIYCIAQTLLPAFVDDISYTNGEAFCYITFTAGVPKRTKLMVRVIYEAFPILSAVGITLGTYFATIRKIRELPEEVLETMDVSIYKLFWYPAVLLITFVPSFLDNFGAIYFETTLPVGFKLLHLLMTHAIGFTNAVVYGIQRKLHHRETDLEKNALVAPFDDTSHNSSILDELERAGGVTI